LLGLFDPSHDITGSHRPEKGRSVKRLILLRHAKSSWDNADLSDSARPLSKRGERTAPLMGRVMAREGYIPDRILCSTAKRAVETGKLVIAALTRKPDYQELEELYMATPREILATIGEQAGNADSILVIGHNPGLGDLATWLVNEGKARDISRLKEKFPTAGLAVIDLPVDNWRDLSDSAVRNWGGRLIRFATPRDQEVEHAAS
jgi:phosphohistidine phosphatase